MSLYTRTRPDPAIYDLGDHAYGRYPTDDEVAAIQREIHADIDIMYAQTRAASLICPGGRTIPSHDSAEEGEEDRPPF